MALPHDVLCNSHYYKICWHRHLEFTPVVPVSYTHLDVYKRQSIYNVRIYKTNMGSILTYFALGALQTRSAVVWKHNIETAYEPQYVIESTKDRIPVEEQRI